MMTSQLLPTINNLVKTRRDTFTDTFLQKNSAQNWGAAYLQEYLEKVSKFPMNTFLKQIHMKSIILTAQ